MNNENSLEEDNPSDKVSDNGEKITVNELALECFEKWSVKTAVYYFYNERNNNFVLQLAVNSATDEITSLRHFLDRKKSELFWYRQLIAMGEKNVNNLRKELIQTRKRNMDLSLRNEYLETLMDSLKEQTKRGISVSRLEKIKDSKLAEDRDMLPVSRNGKVSNQFVTSNNLLEEKYGNKLKKIEDTLTQVLEENKNMRHVIYEKLESLKKCRKSWRWKPVRKLVKRYHDIVGYIREPVLKMFQEKMNIK